MFKKIKIFSDDLEVLPEEKQRRKVSFQGGSRTL